MHEQKTESSQCQSQRVDPEQPPKRPSMLILHTCPHTHTQTAIGCCCLLRLRGETIKKNIVSDLIKRKCESSIHTEQLVSVCALGRYIHLLWIRSHGIHHPQFVYVCNHTFESLFFLFVCECEQCASCVVKWVWFFSASLCLSYSENSLKEFHSFGALVVGSHVHSECLPPILSISAVLLKYIPYQVNK